MTTWTRPRNGKTNVWLTPPEIIAALGPFDLDPCAAPNPRPWPTAANHTTLPDDGLKLDWGQNRVWLNPPFGDQTKLWIKKMSEHRNGIALTFARTDTTWFQESVLQSAVGILFLRGRPSFRLPDGTPARGNSGGAIVLIAYNSSDYSRLQKAINEEKIKGYLVPLR